MVAAIDSQALLCENGSGGERPRVFAPSRCQGGICQAETNGKDKEIAAGAFRNRFALSCGGKKICRFTTDRGLPVPEKEGEKRLFSIVRENGEKAVTEFGKFTAKIRKKGVRRWTKRISACI